MRRTLWMWGAGLGLALGLPAVVNAAVVNLGPGSFTPLAAQITFDEMALGTVNPSLTVAAGSLGNVTVSFAGAFQGQAVTGGFPNTLSDTSPTGPLTLDTSVITKTVNDAAPGNTSPVLSGDPIFNGPISVLFSTGVAAVGLKGGFFDGVGATSITAFDVNGNALGTVVNSVTGFEFFGLAESTGQNLIRGISFYITGNEPFGFEIDNLTFGAAETVPGLDVVPLPMAAWGGFALLGGLGVAKRLRRDRDEAVAAI
jgi:hypothetical protein